MTQKTSTRALRAALEGDLLEVANLGGVVGISPKGHHPQQRSTSVNLTNPSNIHRRFLERGHL